jgi:hypothetical protein
LFNLFFRLSFPQFSNFAALVMMFDSLPGYVAEIREANLLHRQPPQTRFIRDSKKEPSVIRKGSSRFVFLYMRSSQPL